MHEMSKPESGLSETMSLIFMAMLVIIAAILLIASMTGVISNLLQKPALLSAQVIQYDAPGNLHTIAVFHQQGDAVDLNGTSQTGGSSIVSLTLIDTGGLSYTVSPAVPIFQNNQWGPGDTLYIYWTGSAYRYTDDLTTVTPVSLPTGTYTVKIIDNKVNVIINALPVTIR
jgi:hypothetical protein